MIRIDKRVANAALSLTQNYSDEIEYRSETGNLNLMSGYHDVVKSVHLDNGLAEIGLSEIESISDEA